MEGKSTVAYIASARSVCTSTFRIRSTVESCTLCAVQTFSRGSHLRNHNAQRATHLQPFYTPSMARKSSSRSPSPGKTKAKAAAGPVTANTALTATLSWFAIIGFTGLVFPTTLMEGYQVTTPSVRTRDAWARTSVACSCSCPAPT